MFLFTYFLYLVQFKFRFVFSCYSFHASFRLKFLFNKIGLTYFIVFFENFYFSLHCWYCLFRLFQFLLWHRTRSMFCGITDFVPLNVSTFIIHHFVFRLLLYFIYTCFVHFILIQNYGRLPAMASNREMKRGLSQCTKLVCDATS